MLAIMKPGLASPFPKLLGSHTGALSLSLVIAVSCTTKPECSWPACTIIERRWGETLRLNLIGSVRPKEVVTCIIMDR